MKRIFFITLILVEFFLSSFADEQRKITLDNKEHSSETIALPYCNIFVSLKNLDDTDNADITIELENLHESNSILIFDRAYDEKTLKKLDPSITYDNVFGGSKGQRSIDYCSNVKFTNRIRPSEKLKLFNIAATDGSPLVCKLPIYISKDKNKSGSKILLLAKDVIELDIQVQFKPDEEYENFKKSYDSLIKEIDSETFCKNRNHKGTSFAKLKSKYEGKVDELKKKIKAGVDARGYYPQDKTYKKFMEIYDKLGEIDVESKAVGHCPRDRKPIPPDPGHHCNKCSMSYEAIYHRLENYYIDIHNGKKSKSQVIGDVEALYTCVKKNSKRGESSIKERISMYYNKIKAL